ncbi:MAG: branched-chain amino acid transaminase [Planctomycetota bacterium]
MDKARSIWLNGRLVPWDDAHVHVLTHTMHYGMGVFEGIRCYRGDDGKPYVFRLKEHVDRLFDSARIALMDVPISKDELSRAIVETIQANALSECYIRPLIYHSAGALGLGSETPAHVMVAAFPWGAYLGPEAQKRGIRAVVSSLTRFPVNVGMAKAKIVGQYVNSIMAKRMATRMGMDECLLLDAQGNLAEGSGENIFMLRHGRLKTPPLSSPILDGITRATVLELARELTGPMSFEVREETFARDELYTADEVFLTGTAAELTPVREVDFRTIGTGSPGALTRRLQEAFFTVVRGRDPRWRKWLTPVEAATRVTAV